MSVIGINDTINKTQIRSVSFAALFIILIGLSNSLFAFQMPLRPQHHSDSLQKLHFYKPTPARKKKFGQAASQLLLAEAIPWVWDRYILNVDYARVSIQSFGVNVKPSSWTWDGDDFGINEFAHPYHGSTFFSAFRVNGYNFWQSIPASFAGSYLWETFGEKELPSPNDFINTGFGGVVLGEMTYRLSSMIVDNRSRGFRRQAGEVLAFLINPMNGFRRILDRRWGKVGPNTSEHDSSKLYTEFDIGLRNFNANRSGAIFGWYGHVKFLYGNPYENYRKPFSNMSINGEFGKDDSSMVNNINVYGSLAGWEVSSTDKKQQLAILSANYDYIRNESFSYSAQSVKLNLFSNFLINRKISLSSVLGIGPVLLAAVPDPYGYRGRPYAYGSGLGVNGSAGMNLANRLFCSINYRGGLIKTLSGNPSHYFLHAVTGELRYRLLKKVSICFEPGYFNLHAHYKYHSDVNEIYPYLRFSVRYILNQ